MDLNKIQLTPAQLVHLYGSGLVETEVTSIATEEQPTFLGKNKAHILIVTLAETDAFINENGLGFLKSVLTACKLEVDDTAIVNWNNWDKTGAELQEELKSKTVLLFDIDPVTFGLPLNFPHFQTQKFDNRTYLFAPSLAQIEGDTNLKKQLWTSLKKIFQL